MIKKGFTLIELLVVILIIGILATFVIVNVSKSRSQARDAKRVSDLKTIQGALEMYYEKNQKYPMTMASDKNPANSGASGGYSGTNYGWAGLCPSFNKDASNQFTSSGATGWIADMSVNPRVGLAPEFLPVLPSDPKPVGSDGCYIYASNGTDYMLRANKTLETCDLKAAAGSANSCSTSIQEMGSIGMVSRTILDSKTIGVYTSGALNWTCDSCTD